MKVILIDEVHGLGGRGDVVTVRDGYARNYLLPKQLAREATPGNLKAAEMERKKWASLTEQEKVAAGRTAGQLEGVTVIVHKRVGETGTLFGSVTA
ncbi:MAG TPA: 50S ribosomal protein L9, partial [Thermoanaerobaculia bacterium]